jgi:hypothetical protein
LIVCTWTGHGKYFKASELEHGVGAFRKFRDNRNNTDARFSAREKALSTEIRNQDGRPVFECENN